MNATQDELRSFIDRAQYIEAEKATIAETQKELFAELKGRGYDSKAFKEVLRLLKMAPDDRSEFEAIVAMYREAAGL